MPPGTNYLYPRARMVEMIAALYAGGFGFHVAGALNYGLDPLGWAGLDPATQTRLAFVMMLAALAHAAGIRANGAWGVWSILLRIAALVTQTGLILTLAVQGDGQTATYTYGWIGAGLAAGTANAIHDLAVRLIRRAGAV